MGFGYFGPRSAPRANPAAAASPIAANPTGIASVASIPSPTESAPTGIDALSGLTQVAPPLNRMTTSWLPLQITSRSLAIAGLRLFYIVASDRIESSVIGSSGDPETLATAARCEAISQIVAAGDLLAYVVISPGGPAAQVDTCGANGQVSWAIRILDLKSRLSTQVAHGTRPIADVNVAEFPVHVALSATAYAFDRPPDSTAAGPGEAVEVHSLDGALLWTGETPTRVADVMLGGSSLAVLTTGIPGGAGPFDVWVSDAARPVLSLVGQARTSAALSDDGSYLAWDLTVNVDGPYSSSVPTVAIETLASGRTEFVTTPTSSQLSGPIQAAISSTSRGPVVAWFATAPGGTVYPAFRFATGGTPGVFESVQQPVWLHVDGSTLIWVAESHDGWSAMAFAVDLMAVQLD